MNSRFRHIYHYVMTFVHRLTVLISPEVEINRYFRKVFGHKANLISPQSLIEKIYWMQLHCDTKQWSLFADKYRMREYVISKGFGDNLPILYGMWTDPNEIDINKLQKKFVMKANNGCATVLVIKDKSQVDWVQTKKEMKKWLYDFVIKYKLNDEDALSNISSGSNRFGSLSRKSSVDFVTKLTIGLGSVLMVNSFLLASLSTHKYAKEETTINVSINNPIFSSSGRYLLIGDKGSQNLYLIYNTSLQWQKTMEGNISNITVNKNGAVGVVLTGTTYKSVIVMYGITGDEEFKTYLSSTIATNLAISDNNQYLSFAESNTSGTIITSVVKTISIEKAKTAPSEAIVYTYNPENNSLIISIQYDDNNLICQYDNSVYRLSEGNSEKIVEIDDKTLFLDIEMANYICRIQENSTGILSSEYEAKIINSRNSSESTYLLEQMPKDLYCSDSIVAVNLGNEVVFLNHNAWLIKHFSSRQSYRNIVLGDSIAGIIYRDRVEIISL